MAEEQECWLLLAGSWDQSSLPSTGPGAAVSHTGRIRLCLFPFSQLPNPSTTSSGSSYILPNNGQGIISS